MELDVVDIGVWLNRHTLEVGDPAVERLCRQVSDTLRETGVLVVRDPRVSYADNAAFLDMMELYFSQSHEAKMKDVRAELHYQVRRRLRSSCLANSLSSAARWARHPSWSRCLAARCGVSSYRSHVNLASRLVAQMDPRCAEDVALQPKEHRATLPTGADPK
jgi:DNA-binding transcriptional regulator YbjK